MSTESGLSAQDGRELLSIAQMHGIEQEASGNPLPAVPRLADPCGLAMSERTSPSMLSTSMSPPRRSARSSLKPQRGLKGR